MSLIRLMRVSLDKVCWLQKDMFKNATCADDSMKLGLALLCLARIRLPSLGLAYLGLALLDLVWPVLERQR